MTDVEKEIKREEFIWIHILLLSLNHFTTNFIQYRIQTQIFTFKWLAIKRDSRT